VDRARPGDGWNTWDGLPEGHEGRVVSSSLRAVGTAVENPLLPKTKSWFALGAPLELLSPLSCWRILFALTALWCVVAALVGGWAAPNPGVAITAGALVMVWFGLLKVHRVDALASEGLGMVLIGGCAAVVWSGRGGPATWGVAPCFIVGAAVGGMFLPARAIVRLEVVTWVAFVAAWAPIAGLGGGAALASAAGATSSAVAVVAAYLASSARRHGVVDPDTGLPNGFGLARRLAGRASDSPLVVAVVVLGGLAEVREALGYQVGTELLRRIVEDIGQFRAMSAARASRPAFRWRPGGRPPRSRRRSGGRYGRGATWSVGSSWPCDLTWGWPWPPGTDTRWPSLCVGPPSAPGGLRWRGWTCGCGMVATGP